MPRQARKKSFTNVYHIMLRGINQQIIFEEEEDYQYFLFVLNKYKESGSYTLLAYCLMDNHVHLLLKTEEELGESVKRIAGKYVYWYNRKYNRVGHLFQDRFKSEPVETEGSLKNVCRYILQNPVKAGVVEEMEQYDWSNYRAFLGYEDGVTEIELVKDLFHNNAECLEFINSKTDEKYMDISEISHHYISDEKGMWYIEILSGCHSASEFQKLDRKKRNECLKKLKNIGLSVRQLNRLTGISKSTIGRA